MSRDLGLVHGVAWSPRESGLAIYHTAFPPKQSSLPNLEATIWMLEQSGHLYTDTNRKLVNDFHSTFTNVQALVKELSSGDIGAHLVICSQEYRAKILHNMKRLNSLKEEQHNRDKQLELELEYTLLCNAHLVWQLCEIMIMDQPVAGCVGRQLLDWVRPHLSSTYSFIQETLGSAGGHPRYWDAVYSLILLGDIAPACDLLMEHPNAASKQFRIVLELLSNMPQHKLNNPSLHELTLKWKHWQSQCVACKDQGMLSMFPELEVICSILAGDSATFKQLSPLFETWWHFLACNLLYTDPIVQPSNVIHHAKEAQIVIGQKPANIDNILISILEWDFHRILDGICHHLPWWFSAHLADLLHHYTGGEFKHSTEIREFIIVEYASGLMSHKSLWELGADYLDLCPGRGKATLECLLARVPLDSELKGRKVYRLCQKLELTDLANSTCKIMARRALQNGKLGTALVWAIWSDDPILVSYLCDQYLDEYAGTGNFSDLDLLDHLDTTHLSTDTLVFLSRYRKFHQLYASKDLYKAATELVSLFEVCPAKFTRMLLLDAMPLLQASKTEQFFSAAQTRFLISKLVDDDLKERLDQVHVLTEGQKYEQDELYRNQKDQLESLLVCNLGACIESPLVTDN